jgi:hypothetical protein
MRKLTRFARIECEPFHNRKFIPKRFGYGAGLGDFGLIHKILGRSHRHAVTSSGTFRRNPLGAEEAALTWVDETCNLRKEASDYDKEA